MVRTEIPYLTVEQYVSRKIEDMQTNRFLNRGNPYSKNAILNWKKFRNVWNNFEKYEHHADYTLSSITLDTYCHFMDYCDKSGYAKSSKYLYVTLLRAVLNYAFNEGVSDNRIHLNRNFSTHYKKGENTNVYLTKQEIKKIEELILDADSTMDKVRDVFLIGCYTGQRVSDYSAISINDIVLLKNGDKEYKGIQKRQKKTDNSVIIPLLDEKVISILSKRGGKLPTLGIATINSKIKTICKMAGITEKVKKNTDKGGKEEITFHKKCNLVSSHTARRSCITNLYLERKLNTLQIMSISGHKTEQSFYRYLCQSQIEEAIGIIDAITGW